MTIPITSPTFPSPCLDIKKKQLPTVAILGPTGAGKSQFALEIARTYHGEIISMDSAQIYRGMDIGTAKPSPLQQALIPHHLIDIRQPDQTYSVALFCQDTRVLIEEIHERGKLPIITGGTLLYFKALLAGLDDLPSSSPSIRADILAQAEKHGWHYLHGELAKYDPETAQRLSPNDKQRIGRALEVLQATGKTLSSFYQRDKASLFPHRILLISLEALDRPWLHQRVEERFQAMLENGLVEELRHLQQKYSLHPELPSMRCVGYRQTWAYLSGHINKQELSEQGIAATRQLVKRQMTWLRRIPQRIIINISHTSTDAIHYRLNTEIENFLGVY